MVSVKNVVVVARVTSAKLGRVWVQDQGGGVYSGIELTCNYAGTQPSCAMTRAQISALAAGDVVDISGTFSVFVPATPSGAQARLEIDAPTITKKGQTIPPVALAVPASAVAKDQFHASSDPYKGVYVRVSAGGPFPASSTMANEFQTTCTSAQNVQGTTYTGFEATGGGGTLAVSLGFYDSITYCIPACGYPCLNQVTNQSFTSVAGIVEPDANPNGAVYLTIAPTTDADLPHN